VTVFQHAVKITTQSGKILNQLNTGQHAAFTKNNLMPASTVDLQREAAWQKQRMVFKDRSLEDVAAELDRYRPGRIVIVDASIKNLRLTGVFGTGDTDIALRTIEQSLPVKVSKFTEKLVLLSAK
jgi:transmembrane sensor